MSLNSSRIEITDGTNLLVLTGAGAITVDGSATTQPISGTVTANQGTSPWTIAGTVIATQGTTPWAIDGTVAAAQSGAWTTGRTWALASGTDSVAAVQSGLWTVEQGTPPWSVSVTNFPAVQPISGAVTADQGTSPWVVSGTVAATQSGTWNITNVSGTVSLPTGAATSALQTQPGVDIGDVTVNNASGASAVNIQDGGNTITVDGTITANAGAGSFTVAQATAASLNCTTVATTGTKTTYSSSWVALASATTATDFVTLFGSASKTVKITRIEISASKTTAGDVVLLFIKRSTANSGGTSTTPAVGSHDSTNAAGTAVLRTYTANPASLGTQVAIIRATHLFVPAPASVATVRPYETLYGLDLVSQPIVLRGTAEGFCINLNSTTVTGSSWAGSVTWTEE